MTVRRTRLARPLRGAVVAALIAGSMAMLSTGTAQATGGGVFIACGDANSTAVVSIGHGCTSLTDAITAAVAFSSTGSTYGDNATVELMPGSYCPVTIPPDYDASLSLIGVGPAGLSSDHQDFTGPEAALSDFDLDPTSCGGQPAPDYELNAPGAAPQEVRDVSLLNVAFDGTTANGPANGINAANLSLGLSDVLVQNFRGTGLNFNDNNQFINAQIAKLSVANSAFLNNQSGISFDGGATYAGGSIDDSLIAGNLNGLENDSSLNLADDTIAHNSVGIDNYNFNSLNTANPEGQTLDTIVGANTSFDCRTGGGSGLEPTGSLSGDNLIGPSCEGGSPSDGYPDVDLTNTLAAVALVAGAPTPSIVPPSQALDAGSGQCGGLDDADQIEDPVPANGTCDIGSIQSTPTTTTPAAGVQPTSIDDGTVPANQTAATTVYLTDTGAGLLGTSSVAVTGSSAFTVGYDGCTYQLVTHASTDYCTVSVSGKPTTATSTDTGDLMITTTAGTLDVPLTIKGTRPLTAPTKLTAVAKNRAATITFDPPVNPSEPITGYDVRQSSDGGMTWSSSGTQNDTNGVPTSVVDLTDGTSYIFEVAATDSSGDGDWSAPSTAVTPHGKVQASALTPPAAKAVKAGHSVTLTTTLTDTATSTPISGATVTLTPSGSTMGVTATTGDDGTASVTVGPLSHNTRYSWRYAGTPENHAAKSTSALVTVDAVVTAAVNHKKVKPGQTVELYGTVSPNEVGKSVIVEQLVRGKWVVLPHPAAILSQRLPGGHHKVAGYIFDANPTKKGVETLRAVRGATSTNGGGVSPRVTVRVT